MAKLIFGCGYLGERVAKLWLDAGEDVCAVTRSDSRAERLQTFGLQTLVADVTDPASLTSLPAAETVLFAVGFDRSVGNSIHEVYADGLKNVLAALPSSVKLFIYISTTGVYGPASGNWVDETTEPNPQRDGGKASLAAERLLNPPPPDAGRGELLSSVVLRFAGIYGPDRIPYLAKLRAGEPIAAPSEGWLNLIHVADGARIVVEAEKWSTTRQLQLPAHEIFCVSDGNPVIRGDYYREVARRIGAAPPQFAEPNPSSPAAARAASDKRISNAKLRNEIGYEFRYPSYREGLAAILAAD
ncbi:MAG: NAD-dependent epimerase/dehydratase family protein [Planctomycetota bacterium]